MSTSASARESWICARPEAAVALFKRLMRDENPHGWAAGPSVVVRHARDLKPAVLRAIVALSSRRPTVLPINFYDAHAAFAVYDPRGSRPRLFVFDEAFCHAEFAGVHRSVYHNLTRVGMNDDNAGLMTRLGRTYANGYRHDVMPAVHAALGCRDTCALAGLSVLKRMLRADQPDPRVVFAGIDARDFTRNVADARRRYLAEEARGADARGAARAARSAAMAERLRRAAA